MKSIGVLLAVALLAIPVHAQLLSAAESPLLTPATSLVGSSPGAVASVSTAASTEVAQPASSLDPALLEAARREIETKDAVIARLTKHLDSALARLNNSQSTPIGANTTMAGLAAARAQLEKQNALLRERQVDLEMQLAELSKSRQLLDLENRQLFEALNGQPYVETRVARKNNNTRAQYSGRVAGQP